jgi:hypothetical protein
MSLSWDVERLVSRFLSTARDDYAARGDRVRDENLSAIGEELIATTGRKVQCPYTARTLPWTQSGSLGYARCGIHLVDNQQPEFWTLRIIRKGKPAGRIETNTRALYKAGDSKQGVPLDCSLRSDQGFFDIEFADVTHSSKKKFVF